MLPELEAQKGAGKMHAIVLAHAEVKNVPVRDVFRAAYMYAFEKDIPTQSLDEDVAQFEKVGITPQYVIRYFLELFGGQR